jgi:hypothetical protein
MPMQLDAMLEGLCRKLGLGRPGSLADGLQLVFDDDLVVELEATEGGALSLAAGVAALGAGGREAALAELLAANLGGRGTGAAAFALDADLDEVVLCRRFDPAGLDEAALEAGLEEFLDTLAGWKARFGRGEVGAETAVGRGRTDGVLPGTPAQVIRG